MQRIITFNVWDLEFTLDVMEDTLTIIDIENHEIRLDTPSCNILALNDEIFSVINDLFILDLEITRISKLHHVISNSELAGEYIWELQSLSNVINRLKDLYNEKKEEIEGALS